MTLAREAVVAQRERHLRKERHQRGVQGERSVVQAQELRIAGDAQELAHGNPGDRAAGPSGIGTA